MLLEIDAIKASITSFEKSISVPSIFSETAWDTYKRPGLTVVLVFWIEPNLLHADFWDPSALFELDLEPLDQPDQADRALELVEQALRSVELDYGCANVSNKDS